VSGRFARSIIFVPSGLARASKNVTRKSATCVGIAALLLLLGNRTLQTAVAEGDTRTLSFHHVHTNEDITVTFKRNGRYDQAALKKLNWFMRDWRKDEEVAMEPQIFDLLWEAYREVGGSEPIQIICGYRSPDTNKMLRARSSGVAQYSLHTKGDAIDFFIPGVPLEKIRNVGLRLQRGGVGFYPTSGSPFVHMDTGSIRHWPRMTHDQLVKVFPDGRTVHIPTDGQPLPGYALALADVERKGHAPSAVSLATARNAGVIGDTDEQVADRVAAVPKRTVVASAPVPAPGTAPKPVVVASLAPPEKITTIAAVPMPKRRPAAQIMMAALVPTPKARPALPVAIASVDAILTASAVQALAYAAEPVNPPPLPAEPMRSTVTTTIVDDAAPTGRSGRLALAMPDFRPNDPWLRAIFLTPNVTSYLTMERMGRFDARLQREFMHQPDEPVVAMGFSDVPNPGLTTASFSGPAVVFVATIKPMTRTAALAR
jgi:uncharacterized protein YcbK (DUF882 family)